MNPDDAVEADITYVESDVSRSVEPSQRDISTMHGGREAWPVLTDPISKDSTPLFADYLRRGAKPASEWRCGVEFEVFGYDCRNLQRIDAAQVQTVLEGFASSADDLVFEDEALVEVSLGPAGRITVEPGGQIEFSSAPHRLLSDIEREVQLFLKRLCEIADRHGLVFLATGFDPLRTIEEQRWFPKMRYEVMRPFLATRGRRAWDMMCRTCATQANLDYGSEEDLAKKFILGNRLAPIITAMFANSPFENGRPSGYKSTRTAVWLETDADRSGTSPLALVDEFSLEDFVAYALTVPMIFARRDGRYLDAPAGLKFGDFLERGCNGIQPIFGDWADHLSTIFTDARLKQYVELRSADCGDPAMALALVALWKGLLYDASALDEAIRMVSKLMREQADILRESVARDGLMARSAGVDVLPIAKEIVELAACSLRQIAPDEVKYLDVLREQVIEKEICPADVLLRNWHGSWHGSIEKVIEHLQIPHLFSE